MRAEIRWTWMMAGAVAFAAALGPSPAANAQAQSTDPILLYGIGTDYSEGNSTTAPMPPRGGYPVPNEARVAAVQAYEAHRRVWGAPPIDTRFDGRPVLFWTQGQGRGGFAGNHMPFAGMDRASDGEIFVRGLGAGTGLDVFTAWTDKMCNQPGAENWCRGDAYSIVMRQGNMREPWSLPLLFSHEYVHRKQNQWVGNEAMELAPHWFFEGSANGWGYGLMESWSGYDRASLARKLSVHPNKELFGFFLGLRYYDQPLDVDSALRFYPRNHPDYPADAESLGRYIAAGAERCRDYGLRESPECRANLRSDTPNIYGAFTHVQMAGYLTGSFYRYMIEGRRQGARAVRTMMQRTAPSTSRTGAWMQWIDQGIRAAPVTDDAGNPVLVDGKTVPVWPGGVRQIYTEMIADLTDFPDIVVGSRQGELARGPYERRLWSHGCAPIDLTRQPAISRNVRVAPIAARCFRVRSPRDDATVGAPDSFTVTVTAPSGACDDLQLVSRGEILPTPVHVELDSRCSIAWTVIYDPLNARDPYGLQGYQHVLVVNAADRAVETRWRDVTVDFVYFSIEGDITASAAPEERAEGPARAGYLPATFRPTAFGRPQITRVQGTWNPAEAAPRRLIATGGVRTLPKLRGREPQPSLAPAVIGRVSRDEGGCDAEGRAAFECGEMSHVALASGEMAVLAGGASASLAGAAYYNSPSMARMDEAMGDVATRNAAQAQAQLTAALQRYAATGAEPPGLKIDLVMPRLALGQTGAFPGRVDVGWSDGSPGGRGTINSLGPLGPRWTPAGCNDGYPPSQANVVITANTPGMLVGSFSAVLYQPNPTDDPDAACRQPYVQAGTIQMSFAAVGHLPPVVDEGGPTRVKTVWLERYAVDQLSAVLQAGGGMPASLASGPGFGGGGSPAGGAAVGSSGTLQGGACPTPADIDAFTERLVSDLRASGGSSEVLEQMRQSLRQMPREDLEASVCDWVEQGRP